MKTQLRTAISSTIGGRDYQEDSCDVFLVREKNIACAVVADGMGGHAAGDKASSIAVEACAKLSQSDLATAIPEQFVTAAVIQAHFDVTDYDAQNNVDGRTTIVVAVIANSSVHVANVGDSRAYHLQANISTRVTRDDSIPEMLLAMGEITEAEMATHPDQGKLTRSVGGNEEPSPKVKSFHLEVGDVVLLCSDGFWETVKPEEHQSLRSTRDLNLELDRLCALASERGGSEGDNVSACAVRLEPA